MTITDGIVSINGFRDLPKVASGMDEVFWFAKPEDWYLPPPQTVYGEQDSNSIQVYYAFKSGRDVSSVGVCVAVLRDALVSPSGLVFLNDGSLLYESIFPWQLENILDRFGGELAQDGDRYKAKVTGDVVDHPSLFHAREGGEAGYFHFINSILPRIALRQRLDVFADTPILLNSQKEFASQTLALLNVSNTFFSRGWLRVKKLYYPSPFTFQGDQFTRPRYGSVLLRELLDPVVDRLSKTGGGRRIYLSRGDVTIRRISNEDKIVDVFQEYGFETLTTAGMSIEQQIELFSSASWLASPHGAGLSNMVFMPCDASVIEILSPARLWPTFRTLAARHGRKYHAIIGRSIDEAQTAEKGVGNEDFVCDPQIVRMTLKQSIFSQQRAMA